MSFTMTYVAILGWSPVTRSLFRLKRKAHRDRRSTGRCARGAYRRRRDDLDIRPAVEMDFFKGVKNGELPFNILKQIKQFVAGI